MATGGARARGDSYIIDRRPNERISLEGTKDESDLVEKTLEDLVFGFKEPVSKKETVESETESSASDQRDDSESTDSEVAQPPVEKRGKHYAPKKTAPVWRDEDDEQLTVDVTSESLTKKLRHTVSETVMKGHTYSKRLRNQFESVVGVPEWSKGRAKDSDSESDSESEGDSEGDNLEDTARRYLKRSSKLPKGMIDIKRMRDANFAKPAAGVIQSLQFHPSSNVLLTAGFHKTIDIFQVDGESNPKLQSIHLEKFPVVSAQFTPDGREVIAAGIVRGFFVYDMYSSKVTKVLGIKGHKDKYYNSFKVSPDNKFIAFLGKDGYIIFLSYKSKEWLFDFKMNGTVKDILFTSNDQLLSFGSDGEVYVWDLTNRACIHKFRDKGCVSGQCISASPDGQVIVCGSDSGVVNIYDGSCLSNPAPDPLRSITNLTTSIGNMCVNCTSEVMAVSSKKKKGALKLVHLPSKTVFSNWPGPKTLKGHVTATDFSPSSSFFAVGNDKGKALLFRLNYYS